MKKYIKLLAIMGLIFFRASLGSEFQRIVPLSENIKAEETGRTDKDWAAISYRICSDQIDETLDEVARVGMRNHLQRQKLSMLCKKLHGLQRSIKETGDFMIDVDIQEMSKESYVIGIQCQSTRFNHDSQRTEHDDCRTAIEVCSFGKIAPAIWRVLMSAYRLHSVRKEELKKQNDRLDSQTSRKRQRSE